MNGDHLSLELSSPGTVIFVLLFLDLTILLAAQLEHVVL